MTTTRHQHSLYVLDVPASGLNNLATLLAIFASKDEALDHAKDHPGARVREIPANQSSRGSYWAAIFAEITN